jgi:hypothetical protein
MFEVKGPDYVGYLLLNVPGGSQATLRPVRTLTLRRFPSVESEKKEEAADYSRDASVDEA